jgi:outer membrane receptor protein involved in Fe transport
MKKILFALLMIFISFPLMAQTSIKGNITDSKTDEAIVMADVALYKAEDKTFVKSVSTDNSGNFSIELSEKPNLFYLEIEALGYQPQTVVLKDSGSFFIKLNSSAAQMLDEVTIVSRKKAVSIKGDKIVYDVEQLGIGTANNGLETMQQLPGISLDKDENIKFRGSTGIQIMINGKKSMLQGDALREFIRSLKGDDIKSVEIISQPSARYEATGTTGILNIVLKKDISKTLGGSIYTYGKYGAYFGYQNGGRFFYNNDKWSVNTNGSYYSGKSFNDRSVNQTIESENSTRNLNQNNYWLPTTESYSFNLGIERKLNKNQLISTEWQWYKENENARTTGKTFDYLNNALQNEVNLFKQNKTPVSQVSGNLFYNFTSDSLATKIDAQVNYGYYKKSIDGFQQNDYTNGEIDRLDGINQTQYNMLNAQVDWNQKLSKQLNLESGAKMSFVDMNYFNLYDAVQGSNFIIPDSLMMNDFRYKEKLASAYTQLNYSIGKWKFLSGLRMENYHYEATSNINQQTNKGSYMNWFPSASVNYENGNHQYRLSYSKRISRPGYLRLNPYFQYLDAYSIEKGNPNLKPQFYHSFELNYIYKNALSFGLYGYLYKDGFVSVIDYQDNENYNILYESNASNGSRFGFSTSIPNKVGKWWTMQYTLDTYLESQKSKITDYAYDGTGYGFEFNMYHRFTLPKSWAITWNGFLTGRNKTPTGYNPVIYDCSTSVRKPFMNEKLQLAAGCTNILEKSIWNNYSTVNNVTTHWINKWETRKFYLQLTYRFGGNKEKKVKSTSLNDENNRM